MPLVRLLLGLLFAQILSGCGGGNGSTPASGSSPPPTVPPPTVLPPTVTGWNGRWVGTVKIGAVTYFGDALVTVDGLVRLYVGGPYAPSGVLQMTIPGGSAQFIGKLAGPSDHAAGSGVVIGQGCKAPNSAPFCSGTAPGEMSIAMVSGDIQGKIVVTTNSGTETWSLELGPFINYYTQPATPGSLAGRYTEQVAEFAMGDDMIISVDYAGLLSFHSAHSGCTGNGTLVPHLDGTFQVFDVILTLQGCNGPYVHLNGDFEGLASTSPGTVWDYDMYLRIWMSQPDSVPSRAAVTMLSAALGL
jgi:hypothetical protein